MSSGAPKSLSDERNTSPLPSRGTTERAELVGLLSEKAKMFRKETFRLSRIAGAGHYGGALSAAELIVALYYAQLRYQPSDPAWLDRDRFVLSKGHAAIGLYPVLADVGFFDPALLDSYTRLGSIFGDHPDMRKVPGIDFSSGSLGHGLSVALGQTLAARVQGRSYRTYCLLGDGELAEGQVWEAAMAAGHFKAGSLIAIVDRNQFSIDGLTETIMGVEPLDAKFAAFRWNVRRVDGHNLDAILDTFAELADEPNAPPQLIIADTIKARGVQRMEGNADWHVGNLVGSDYDDVLSEIDAGLQPSIGSH
jgi:transketolase